MSDITTTWSLDARKFSSGVDEVKRSANGATTGLSSFTGGLGRAAGALGLVAGAAYGLKKAYDYSKEALVQYEDRVGSYYGAMRQTAAIQDEIKQEWGAFWYEQKEAADAYAASIGKVGLALTKALTRPATETEREVRDAQRAERLREGRERRNGDVIDDTARARIQRERAGLPLGFVSPDRARELIERENRIETEAAIRATNLDKNMAEVEKEARNRFIRERGAARLDAQLAEFSAQQALATRASSSSVRASEEEAQLQSLRLKNLKGEAELLGISLSYRKQMLDVERNPALTGAEKQEQLQRLAAARDQLTEASAKDLVRSSKYDLAKTQASLQSITLAPGLALPGLSAAVFAPGTNANAPPSELVRSMEGLRNDIKAGTQALNNLKSSYAP